MEAKIRAGNSGIDVVVPSNYAIEGWVADSLIEPLDYAKLPDFVKADWNAAVHGPGVRQGQHALDPEELGHDRHRLPQLEGDRDVTTWKQFFEVAGTTYEGKTLIVDHQISSFGSAAVAMGYSLNTIDPTEMAAVEAMLTALKPKLFAISSDVQPPLRALDTWLSIAWTGDGVQVGRDNEDARYLVATDGGELWIDSYTVAADAPHRDAAYAFLNYITQPEQAARGDGVLPLPARQRQGDRARCADEIKNNAGDLSAGRLAGQARVRRQRDVQQRRAGRGVGPHQGVRLGSDRADDRRAVSGTATAPRATTARCRRPARPAGRAVVPRLSSSRRSSSWPSCRSASGRRTGATPAASPSSSTPT